MKYWADIVPYGQVKCLRTDNGMEFTSEPFQWQFYQIESNTRGQLLILCIKMGLLWTVTVNFIFYGKRCLFIESKLPQILWVYALVASVYIRNCCYNKNTRKTSYESFIGSRQNLNKTQIFGMICFCNRQNKTKLDPHCEKGIFFGYDKQSSVYLV